MAINQLRFPSKSDSVSCPTLAKPHFLASVTEIRGMEAFKLLRGIYLELRGTIIESVFLLQGRNFTVITFRIKLKTK